MENAWSNRKVEIDWAVVGRQYGEMMEEVTPYLAPAEQIVYQRLFFLSYAQGQSYAACRYEELCGQCGLSLRTVQRALQGLRTKKLVKTRSHSHAATIFEVRLLSQLPHRPAFLPRQRRHPSRPPTLQPLRTPPVYEQFTSEDRELFVEAKRSLSPATLNTLIEEAVEWLTERAHGDPTAFSDESLRDKVDELVFRKVFGPERQRQYTHVFEHLYAL